MRAAVEALGRDPSELGVVGNAPMARDAEGGFDVGAAMAAAPALVEAGVTDVRFTVAPPPDRDAATEYLGDLVAQFRAAVG
jgi:hypothetical protein